MIIYIFRLVLDLLSLFLPLIIKSQILLCKVFKYLSSCIRQDINNVDTLKQIPTLQIIHVQYLLQII